MPVGIAFDDAASTWVIGTAGLDGATALCAAVAAGSAATSSTVPHSPHSGQRPTHFATEWPHAEQRNVDLGFATNLSLGQATDTSRHADRDVSGGAVTLTHFPPAH